MSRTASTVQSRRIDPLPQDALMLKAFRDHLKVVSEATLLDLLILANIHAITNSDVRKVLGLRARGSAWRWLSKLTKLNMLERQKDGYRASVYGKELVAAISLVFQGAMKGRWTMGDADRQQSEKLLRFAEEGTESLYERGRIDETEYQARLRLIKDLKATLV